MPFNTLILTCLTGKTSFQECGAKIGVAPTKDEKVLFFVIDQNSNNDSTARADFDINGPICDLVVYYAAGPKKVLCIVEVKGSDVQHAVDQIVNTKQRVFPLLKRAVLRRACRQHCDALTCKAYVYKHGSAPKNIKSQMLTLVNAFGRENFAISSDPDLGGFLRK